MKYRLMTHTQQFFEDGQWVIRQLALDENDAAYWFTAERVAQLASDDEPDCEVERVDDQHRDPFAEPDQSAVQPTIDPDATAGHEAPVAEPDLPEAAETDPSLGPDGKTGGRILVEEPEPTFGPGGDVIPPEENGDG